MANPRWITAAEVGQIDVPSYQAGIVLTNAQVIALPTTQVEIAATPADDNIILVPVFAFWHLNWVADYDNIGNTGRIGIGWGTAKSSPLSAFQEAVGGQVSNLLIDGSSHPAFMSVRLNVDGATNAVSSVGQISDDPLSINAALNIYAVNSGSHTGNYTGGDAGNSISVGLIYHKFNLVTGAFV